MSHMEGLHIRHIGHIGHMYGPPTSLMDYAMILKPPAPCKAEGPVAPRSIP